MFMRTKRLNGTRIQGIAVVPCLPRIMLVLLVVHAMR